MAILDRIGRKRPCVGGPEASQPAHRIAIQIPGDGSPDQPNPARAWAPHGEILKSGPRRQAMRAAGVRTAVGTEGCSAARVKRKRCDDLMQARILEDGFVTVDDRGTGQGSVISPLLANVDLHYCSDLWAARWPGTRPLAT